MQQNRERERERERERRSFSEEYALPETNVE
jgi:hypothetical protein